MKQIKSWYQKTATIAPPTCTVLISSNISVTHTCTCKSLASTPFTRPPQVLYSQNHHEYTQLTRPP